MTRPPSSGPDDFDPTDPRHWPPPPEPTEARWDVLYQSVARALPRRRPWWKGGAAVGVLAAAALIAWAVWPRAGTVPPPPPEPVEPRPADPLAGYDVLPIATADDVMVHSVRGSDVGFASIDHPIPETMPLATSADVSVHRGPTAGALSCPEPGDMPVYVMPPTDK